MALRNGRPIKLPALTSRTTRWLIGLGLGVLVAIGLGLLVLLTQATNNLAQYDKNYDRLLLVNGVVAAVVPGVLIYTVSYQFVSRSIESWFDVKVEGALAAGLTLGRVTLDTLSQDLTQKTRQASMQLADVSDVNAGVALEKLREQLGARDALLWTGSGRLLASAGSSRFVIRPDKPTAAQVRQARSQGGVAWVDGLDEAAPGGDKAHIQALVVVPQLSLSLGEELRLLQVVQDLPPTLVTNALEVQQANREYQERALAREGLRRMYIGTLTLSLFMAVLGAILLAVLLGNQLARPLLLLAQGMRQVAAGDLTPKLALQGKDELRGLTRSFADMTQQRADARGAVEHSLHQLDQARANLQTILDNLTTGVIVLDPHGTILSSNPGATRILRVPVAVYEARPLMQLPQLQEFAAGVQEAFDQLGTSSVAHELDHWQKAFEVHVSGQGLSQSSVTLLARGEVLPDGMRLLVFDDISEIVSAERTQAWGEVARRLAHEIKNPLTPIQLSAERLERKLEGKLTDADAAVLGKSVRTIVDQVDAMNRLVNEFRDYARLPAAELKPLDLNALIGDVLALYGAEGAGGVDIVRELDSQCPPIPGDAQQLRQVVHNLLQNAQDACETMSARAPRIVIRTEWHAQRQRVRLSVLDSGPGFEQHILQRAFEPYVTTKTKGTGLGLAVVKKIADDHRARIDLGNVMQDGQVVGAQVSLSFILNNASPGA